MKHPDAGIRGILPLLLFFQNDASIGVLDP